MSTPTDPPQEAPSSTPQALPPTDAASQPEEKAPPAPGNPSSIKHNKRVFGNLRELLDMIKFEHTVFALPFAFLGGLGAVRGLPPWEKVLWILLAMVGARTAAMTFNRLADEEIDGENPRTRDRALPAGRVSRRGAMALLGASVVLFGFSAGMLGPLPWKLAPLALLIILGYSFCKRFTFLSHGVLGLSLSGAPLGAWIAVNGRVDAPAVWLALGVLTWTAGFDILYALQDQDFDRKQGLHSVPSRLGTPTALLLSRGLHSLAVMAFGFYNLSMDVHVFPWLAWIAVLFILAREQWVVRGGRLDRIDHAFFTLNSLVGLIFFAGHAAEWAIAALIP